MPIFQKIVNMCQTSLLLLGKNTGLFPTHLSFFLSFARVVGSGCPLSARVSAPVCYGARSRMYLLQGIGGGSDQSRMYLSLSLSLHIHIYIYIHTYIHMCVCTSLSLYVLFVY